MQTLEEKLDFIRGKVKKNLNKFSYVVREKDLAQIALEAGLSVTTVKNYIANELTDVRIISNEEYTKEKKSHANYSTAPVDMDKKIQICEIYLQNRNFPKKPSPRSVAIEVKVSPNTVQNLWRIIDKKYSEIIAKYGFMDIERTAELVGVEIYMVKCVYAYLKTQNFAGRINSAREQTMRSANF